MTNPKAPCCKAPKDIINESCLAFNKSPCGEDEYRQFINNFKGYKVRFGNLSPSRDSDENGRTLGARSYFGEIYGDSPFFFRISLARGSEGCYLTAPGQPCGGQGVDFWNTNFIPVGIPQIPVKEERPPLPPFWSWTGHRRVDSNPPLNHPKWNRSTDCPIVQCSGSQCNIYADCQDSESAYEDMRQSVLDDFDYNLNFYQNQFSIKVGTSILERISNKEFFIPYNSDFDSSNSPSNLLRCRAWSVCKSFKITEPIVIRYLTSECADVRNACQSECKVVGWGGGGFGGIFNPSMILCRQNLLTQNYGPECERANKRKVKEIKLYPILQISVRPDNRFSFGQPIREHLLGEFLLINIRIAGFYKITGSLEIPAFNTPPPFFQCECFFSPPESRPPPPCIACDGSRLGYFFGSSVDCSEKRICPQDESISKIFNFNGAINNMLNILYPLTAPTDTFRGLHIYVKKRNNNVCLSDYHNDLRFNEYFFDEIDFKGYLWHGPYRVASSEFNFWAAAGFLKAYHRYLGDFGTHIPKMNQVLINAITTELVFQD